MFVGDRRRICESSTRLVPVVQAPVCLPGSRDTGVITERTAYCSQAAHCFVGVSSYCYIYASPGVRHSSYFQFLANQCSTLNTPTSFHFWQFLESQAQYSEKCEHLNEGKTQMEGWELPSRSLKPWQLLAASPMRQVSEPSKHPPCLSSQDIPPLHRCFHKLAAYFPLWVGKPSKPLFRKHKKTLPY